MKLKMTTFLNISFVLICFFACKNDTVTVESPEEIITINSDWFDVSHLSPQTYIIEERQSSQGNVSYLILGKEKALMYDTGAGENEPENGLKIKHIIDQLTNLPVTLLLSHFHFDHNQNIAEFNTVAFPDLPFLRQQVAADNIYHFTSEDLVEGNYPAQVEVKEWLPVNTDIDLGDRIIQLVNIPGHTSESVAIIDSVNKSAFLGDFLYNGELFVFDENDLSLYKESTDYLLSILSEDYNLYGAHGAPKINYSKLQTLKDFLICIENNECPPTNSTLWGFPVILYEFGGMNIVVFQ